MKEITAQEKYKQMLGYINDVSLLVEYMLINKGITCPLSEIHKFNESTVKKLQEQYKRDLKFKSAVDTDVFLLESYYHEIGGLQNPEFA